MIVTSPGTTGEVMSHRQLCNVCNRKRDRVFTCKTGNESRCKQCQLNDKHTHTQQQQQQHTQQLEFCQHTDDDTQRMTPQQRDAIIVLHQRHESIDDICAAVGCAKSTAYRWINRYEATHALNDDAR